jgi:RIO kinase 1
VTFLGDEPRARPAPEWLITDDYDEIDHGPLKAGKEAEVFVVERVRGDRSCLLAHKRYRPRKVGKGELESLGFQRSATFVNDVVYHEGRRFRRTRDRRAVERMTGYGKGLLNARWPGHELEIMTRLWGAGADVPYPVGFEGDGMLMEFVGDRTQAAPRLAQARLSREEIDDALEQVVTNLRRFVAAGVVHADLSAFNVLWWDGRVWFIDFPQAADLLANPSGFELLHRDVVNLMGWFGRRGAACDADEVYAELLAWI